MDNLAPVQNPDFSQVTKNPDQGTFQGVQTGPSYQEQVQTGFNKGLEGAGTFGLSAINSALMNVPELALKWSGSPMYQQWKKTQEENPMAAAAGDIVGYLPAGPEKLLVGGAEKLALKGGESLAGKTAEKFLSMYKEPKTILQAAGKGAFQAGANAVPYGLSEYAETGDPEALKAIPMQVGLGGGLGAAGKVFSMGGDYFLSKLKDPLLNTQAKSLGITDGTLRLYKKAGLSGNNALTKEVAQGARDDVLKTFSEYGIKKPEDIPAIIKDNKLGFNQIDEAAQNIDADTIGSSFYDSKTYKSLSKQYGSDKVDAIANQYVKDLNARPTMYDKRDFLFDQGYLSKGAKTVDERMSADIAKGFHDTYDDLIDDAGKQVLGPDVDFGKMKHDYRVFKSWEDSQRYKMETLFPEANSATAPREGLMSLLEGVKKNPGAVAGAGLGYWNNREEFNSPDTFGEGLTNIGLSTLGGAMLNKALPKLANKALLGAEGGIGALGKSKLINNPVTQEVLKNYPRFGAAVKPITDQDMQNNPTMQSVNPFNLTPDPNKPWQTQNPDEQRTPEGITKDNWYEQNPEMANRLLENLRNRFAEMGGFYRGMNFGLFVQNVKERTNNFRPDKVAHLIYDNPEDQEKLRDAYGAYLKIAKNPNFKGNLIDEALKYKPINAPIIGDINQFGANLVRGTPLEKSLGKGFDEAENQRQAVDVFTEILSDIENKSGRPPRPNQKKMIENEIINALRGGGTPEARRKRFVGFLNSQGIDLETLEQMGIKL